MKIGLTTYGLNDKDFREQLSSMLKSGIKPDFIILHYAGIYKFSKGLKFLRRTLKQQRLKSISFLLSYKKNRASISPKFKLCKADAKEVELFIPSLKIIKAKGINNHSTIQTIGGLGDTLIVSNSGKLNKEVISIPTAIFLNIHASKLPQYRGMNNIEWALWENNDIYATIHRISQGMDEGDILYQEKIDIQNRNLKTIEEYREYCFFKCNELIGKAIKGYLDGKLSFTRQDTPKTPISQYYIMHPILKEYLRKKLANK